jgi:hypothetical protein
LLWVLVTDLRGLMSDNQLRRRAIALPLVLAAAGVVAGCSSTSDILSSTGLSRYFGNSGSTTTTSASGDPTVQQDIECPTVEYRVGAASLSLTAPGEQTTSSVRYLLSFSQTARECFVSAGTMTMKVGVEGRVVVGAAGGPGNVAVPIRFAVVKEGPEPKTIVTKLQQTQVTVPPEAGNVPFISIVDDIVFPIPPGDEIDAYVVYVGFDPQGAPRVPAKKGPTKRATKKN